MALTWCALELVGGSVSYGTLMAVLQLVACIQAPGSSLSGMMPQLYQTLASAERLMEAADDKALSLSCSDAFVPKGSFVVVEGPSGSGKSTLFKLALGAYDADGFAYELEEGASCAASQVPAGAFAYVPQDNFLFAGTVRENVAFAAPDANDDQVRRACEAACAWDFVEELPQRLDTAIDEYGQGLSQGQLQRLAIARAVCSGAPVMVLDEVTSALDGKTEADVLANIAVLPGRTVFVAAHCAKAREFATLRLRVDGGVVSGEG